MLILILILIKNLYLNKIKFIQQNKNIIIFMEDKYPIKEIKIMEGVYIWKPETKTVNNAQGNNNVQPTNNNNNNNQNITSIGENKYLCNRKEELVKIYETEFEEIGSEVQDIFQSNEEMLEYDPHDYDLIQAREENLQIIDRKLEEMVKIQKKMKELCDYHPIVNINIFEHFGIGQSIKIENKNKEEDKKNDNLIMVNGDEDKKKENNINSMNEFEDNKENNSLNKDTQKEDKTQNNNNIVTEIEL